MVIKGFSMKLARLVVFLMILAAGIVGLAQEMQLPEEIVIEAPGILPEGVEYDAEGGRFLIGSLTEGTIREVLADGTTSEWVVDEELIASVGIHIDKVNNLLLVCNADSSVFFDPEARGLAALAAYDLETGERVYYVDMSDLVESGQNFANDVTSDEEGNAYVTNSFAPVIYKVDPEGNAEILIEDERLGSDFFGLNGIEYHPDGYLLAAVAGNVTIYKIPLDDPSAMTEVALSEPFGVDGMALAPDGTLAAVAFTGDGSVQEIVVVSSEDDWESAEITARVETTGEATTLALYEETVYYINAYLSNPAATQYEIVRVDFPEE